MKTVIIILVILALLCFFEFITISFFQNETSYYSKEIDEIISYINNGNYFEAEDRLNTLEKHWLQKRTVWNMICDHDEVEIISLRLNTAISSFKHQKYNKCVTALSNLDLNIEFSGDRYSMKIDNIS